MRDRIRTCGCDPIKLEHQRRNEAAGFYLLLCLDHAAAHDNGYTFLVTREEYNR